MSERINKEQAGKMLSMASIVYHAAISPNSKPAQKWIAKTTEQLKKAMS